MQEKLLLGFIGCGRISYAHREAALQLKDTVAIVAACDVDENSLAEFCKATGIQKQYKDYHVLLHDQLDAVIICLPNFLHHPVTIESLKSGKHVLVEKPMALTYDQTQQMADTAETVSKTLMVAQNRRFSHAAIELKRLIDKGEIGELVRIVVNLSCYFADAPTQWWYDGEKAGDPFLSLQQGSHAVDTVAWLFNENPNSVYASCFKKRFPFDDECDIIMKFENATASVHLSLNTRPPVHEVIAVGTEGTLRLNEFSTGKAFGFGYELKLNDQVLLHGPQEPSNFTLQLKEFVQSIQENRDPVAGGRKVSSTTMKVLSLAQEAIVSKKIIANKS